MLEVAKTDVMARVTAQVVKKADRLTEKAQRRSEKINRGGWFSRHFDEKSQWSNWTVLAMLVLCFLTLIQYRSFSGGIFGRPAGVGSPLSALELESLDEDGRSVTLADLTGRVVLLHFWQPWSEPSHETLPKLAAVEGRFRAERGVRFLAVSCGQDSPEYRTVLRQQTDSALAKLRVRLPGYADPDMVTRNAVDRAVGLRGYPVTVILDRRGRIRQVWHGLQPGADGEMRQLVAKLLKET